MVDADVLREKVRGALQAKIQSDTAKEYFALMAQLKEASEPEQVRDYFRAIAHSSALVSRNHNKFSDLLSLVFLYDWSYGPDVSEAFKSILCALVASNAGFLEPVFNQLVSNFFPLTTEEEAESDSDDSDSDDEEDDKPKQELVPAADQDEIAKARSDLVHNAIQSVLQIVPLGCSQLLPVLISNFPRQGEKLPRQLAFVREALRVCQYVPVLRDRIIALTFKRLLNMDTDISLEDLSGEDSVADGIFDMDEQDVTDSATMTDEERARKLEQFRNDRHRKRIRDVAEKLDQMLVLILDYSDRELNHRPRVSQLYFELMMNIFDQLVLRNRMSKFVQFVMFYICRKRSDFVDRFVERLLQRALGVTNASNTTVDQLSAASYLGGFLARGLYVRVDSTRSALQHMMDWLHAYHKGFEERYYEKVAMSGSFVVDPQDHVQFFAVCHAVAYVLMFKGEDLSQDQIDSLDLSIIATGSLKPYFHFSQALFNEFIRFAQEKTILTNDQCKQMTSDYLAFEKVMSGRQDGDEATQFFTSQKIMLKSSSNKEIVRVLAEHYPFDPCLLRRIAERVNPFYQHWLSKYGSQHTEEYALCDAEIEDEAFITDEEDAADRAEAELRQRQEQQLVEGQTSLPPQIHIPGLSQRAARMLQHLGANSAILGGLQNAADDPWTSLLAPSSNPSSPGSMAGMSHRSEASGVSLSGAGGNLFQPMSLTSASPMSMRGSYGTLSQRFMMTASSSVNESVSSSGQDIDSTVNKGQRGASFESTGSW